jgi:hypothetical protein
MWLYWDGQDTDPESGERKIDHRALAMACLGIWMDAESCGKLNDDRGPPGALDKFLAENTVKKTLDAQSQTPERTPPADPHLEQTRPLCPLFPLFPGEVWTPDNTLDILP